MSNTIEIEEQQLYDIIKCVSWVNSWNIDGFEFKDIFYPDRNEYDHYIRQKYADFSANPMMFFSKLDQEHRMLFVHKVATLVNKFHDLNISK